MLDQITPLVLTFNEAPNIGRSLQRLTWAKEVVVMDSFSSDDTLAIARSFPNVRVVQRAFDTFAEQCNFGLDQIQTPWVLSLDADYILSEELIRELAELSTLNSELSTSGFSSRFRYCIHGRPLRASLYPPRTVLYRKEKARYHNEGHGHRVQIDGPVNQLSGWIDHDDRKPLDRWFNEQLRYSAREAEHLLQTPLAELNRPDRIRRRIIFAPALVFFYTLFGKGLILDGWPGWHYVLQRTVAELLLSMRLLEQKLGTKKQKPLIDTNEH
jgi:glycosyltransferase involved in cell wall biosynthesis